MPRNPEHQYIYGETFSPEAPKPTAVAYEVLSRHIEAGANNPETHEVLNDIYKALGGSEREVSLVLDTLEQNGIVNREEMLMLVVFLVISKTLGPDVDFLRQAILSGSFNADEIHSKIENTNLDRNIIDFLQNIIGKFRR